MEIMYWLVGYLVLGLAVLYVTNRLTNNRLRNNLTPASYETQEKLAQGYILTQGTPVLVSSKAALIITTIALIVFWPVALFGALTAKKRGENER